MNSNQFQQIDPAALPTGHNELEERVKERTAELEAVIQTQRQQIIELQLRNEELDTFAYTVAHDLQGPLTHIIGFADAVSKGYTEIPPEEVQEYLQVIGQSARKLSNIVDELLLLASVRGMVVKLEPLDMTHIVAEARQRLADMIETHQAEIILPATWLTALGYGPWIEEVWVNYLSNAIKYGGRPPRLKLGAAAQLDGMIRFWIQDNGPGLEPEEQAKLFRPFIHLSQTWTQGHGLGLSIVRHIIEKLGGQVGVESDGRLGHGSIFTFTLPGLSIKQGGRHVP